MKLPSSTNLDTLASTVETDGLKRPTLADAREASPSIAEFVDRLGSFLILVGLAGLAVGGIGVSSAVRHISGPQNQRDRDAAQYRCR